MNHNENRDALAASAAIGAFGKAKLTTKEFAAALNLQQHSIRSALCRAGHYLGLVPVKLPNGRMLWDAQAVTRLINLGHA